MSAARLFVLSPRPVDVRVVLADDLYLQDLRAGHPPAPGDRLSVLIAAGRDHARAPGGPSVQDVLDAYDRQRADRQSPAEISEPAPTEQAAS